MHSHARTVRLHDIIYIIRWLGLSAAYATLFAFWGGAINHMFLPFACDIPDG